MRGVLGFWLTGGQAWFKMEGGNGWGSGDNGDGEDTEAGEDV